MPKKLPVFYSALLLTAVNLLLRLAGTGFQVYLSGLIGAEGIGMLQLVMSVGSLALVSGMAGIRTATMYLTAEEYGCHRISNLRWVLSGCIAYSILSSGSVAVILCKLSPWLARNWIGSPETEDAIRMFAAFLPVNCLCGVLSGYFTGADRIGTLAAVEVLEQVFSVICTITLLHTVAGTDPAGACMAVIMGSGMGACLTLTGLAFLRNRENQAFAPAVPVCRRLVHSAVPLALADNLRTGISTVEQIMVPKRLSLFPGVVSPLATFGTVYGMVFPVLMFPASILYGLTELLVPELARCHAAGSRQRITYLAEKSLRVGLLYGLFSGGFLFLNADDLCISLYGSLEAAGYLRLLAPLTVMLYSDSIVDAMVKGLGQQKASVRYNILTNSMDVCLLFVLLPQYGMGGYFFSFVITHCINFYLSLGRLVKITQQKICIKTPLLAIASGIGAAVLAETISLWPVRTAAYFLILSCLLFLLGVLSKEDILWIKCLIYNK